MNDSPILESYRARPLLLLIPLALCLCGALACAGIVLGFLRLGQSQPAASTGREAGRTVIAGDFAMEVRFERPADEWARDASPFNPPPGPGREYLRVIVSAECNADLCTIAPERFAVHDAAGTVFRPVQLDLRHPLVAATLRRGERVAHRSLVFEVALGAERLRLVHRAGLVSGPETEFVVP
jgi:hypothetical protein